MRTAPSAVAGALLAACLCATVSHAADVLFFDGRRCNTNFRNAANWDQGTPDSSGNRLLVKFASATDDKEFKQVKTRVQFGDYNINKLQLASNMVLQLDSDDVLFRFESSVEPEAIPTRFTGGQTYREECDFNCHKSWYLKEGTRRSTFQPKAPPCSRDVAVLDQEFDSYNLWAHGEVNVRNMIVDNTEIFSGIEDIPTSAQYMFNDGVVAHFDDQSACRARGHANIHGDCICASTCPDAQQGAEQEVLLRQLAKTKAEADLNVRLERRVGLFSLTVPYSVSQKIIENHGNCTGESCPLFIDTMDCLFVGQLDPPQGVLSSLRRAVETYFPSMLALQWTYTRVEDPNGSPQLVLEGSLTAPAQTFEHPGPADSVVHWWQRAVVLDESESRSNPFYRALWSTLYQDANRCLRTEILSDEAATRYAADQLAAFEKMADYVIEVARFDSPAFVVGAALPQVDLHFMINSDNLDRLKGVVAEQLVSLSYFVGVSDVRVTLKPGDGRRRRGEIQFGAAHDLLKILFAYDMVEGDGCPRRDFPCRVQEDTPTYNDIRAFLDDIVANFQADFNSARPTAGGGGGGGSATTIDPDVAGAEGGAEGTGNKEAAGAFPVVIVAAAAGVVLVLIIVIILLAVRLRNKSRQNEKERAAAGGEEAAYEVQTTAMPAQTKEKKEKKPNKEKSGSGSRSVVAFANPMYDGPSTSPHGKPDDGLYDEPAFQSKGRSNPLYDSNEGLEEEEAGSGYLDVQPE